MIFVSMSASTPTEAQAVRAIETLARAMAGLALEGLTVSLTVGPMDEDDDPEARA